MTDGAERLLLDEMFAPGFATALCSAGYDVLAVAGHPVLGAASDEQVARAAREQNRRVATENVRDFAPLVGTGEPPLRVLFTSARRFPRSRRNPGPLTTALLDWLAAPGPRTDETWLR